MPYVRSCFADQTSLLPPVALAHHPLRSDPLGASHLAPTPRRAFESLQESPPSLGTLPEDLPQILPAMVEFSLAQSYFVASVLLAMLQPTSDGLQPNDYNLTLHFFDFSATIGLGRARWAGLGRLKLFRLRSCSLVLQHSYASTRARAVPPRTRMAPPVTRALLATSSLPCKLSNLWFLPRDIKRRFDWSLGTQTPLSSSSLRSFNPCHHPYTPSTSLPIIPPSPVAAGAVGQLRPLPKHVT